MRLKLVNLKNKLVKCILSYKDALINNKKLFVLIGRNNTYIAAYNGQQLISLNVIRLSEYKVSDHASILDNFKEYIVHIILDTTDVVLHDTAIPVAQELIRGDHVGGFVKKNFGKSDLVSYAVYDKTHENTDILHTCFASVTPSPLVEQWCEWAASTARKLCGVYFFNMLVPNLTSYFLGKAKLTTQSALQIFVTATSTNGVRVVTTYKNNIMDSRIVQYPMEKSQEYIQGIIEQELSDRFIALKHYMHHNQVKPSVIMLVGPELQALLSTATKFDVADWIVLPSEVATTQYVEAVDEKFMDATLLLGINNINVDAGAATNNDLKSFFKLSHIRSRFFKPVWLICAVLFVDAALNYATTRSNKIVADNVNNQYYAMAEKYRTVKDKYPNISDLTEIINYQEATLELQKAQYLPFDTLDGFLAIVPQNLVINSIYWSASGSEFEFVTQQDGDAPHDSVKQATDKTDNTTIVIRAKYVVADTRRDTVIAALDAEIAVISRTLTDVKVQHVIDENDIVVRGGNTYVPVQITIDDIKIRG